MTFENSYYQSELNKIIHELEKKTHLTYVKRYVTYPAINMLQLHFTYLFLTANDAPVELIEALCISQASIQLGLDSHEEVMLETITDEQEIKSRQLTVLSGDFFSSYYYYFLANTSFIEYIPKWANAIQQLNEMKADLHFKAGIISQSEKWDFQKQLRQTLTNHLMRWFDADESWHLLYSALIELEMQSQLGPEQVRAIADLQKKIEKLLLFIANKRVASEVWLMMDKLTEGQLVTGI